MRFWLFLSRANKSLSQVMDEFAMALAIGRDLRRAYPES